MTRHVAVEVRSGGSPASIMGFGQVAATTQFFLYGKRHFTKTGYDRHVKSYAQPRLLETVDLSGKVFMVTGANSGLGKEITRYLASRKARVYMVCRSKERAEEARSKIVAEFAEADLPVLLGDCSLEADVRRVWAEFSGRERALHGLCCNAGALLNEKTLTSEGHEVTFAAHLLFGAYLLGKLAIDCLASSGGRLVLVSSGGMYNHGFPEWEVAASLKGEYDGNLAYSYMKRGQVLLAEHWAREHPNLKVVSSHPGWASTEGVDKAFGESKSLLDPMRSAWEGAEGICWLFACDLDKIVPGASVAAKSFRAER